MVRLVVILVMLLVLVKPMARVPFPTVVHEVASIAPISF
jgi:hypothetical protein